MSLTAEEARIAREEWHRLGGARTARDPRISGCLVAFCGMLLLTLVPAVGGWLEIPPGLAVGFLTLAILLLGGGAALGLVGTRRRERRDGMRRGEARRLLESWRDGGVSDDEAVRAAVRFVHAGGGGLQGPGSDGTPLSRRCRTLVDQVARATSSEPKGTGAAGPVP